jgi:hypothetical protein
MITIYGFLDDPAPNGGWDVIVTCECGAVLQYVATNAEQARYDIGVTSQEKHVLYRAHCAKQHQGEPFQVQWLDDPSSHQWPQQPGIEVVDWSKDDFAALADQLQTEFPHEKLDIESDDEI